MKSLAFYISVLSLGGALLASCNIIELQPPAAAAPLSDKAALDSAETKNGIETPVKKILLEDYTGHQCGNCPGAAIVAKAQKAQYGERLVVMAVHAGYFAEFNTAPFTTNFTTPEGEEWWTTFGGVANPVGMINRIKTGTSTFQGVSTWSGLIDAQMALTPKVGMTLTTVYRPATRLVNIKVHSEYLENLTGEYDMAVFITEDGIVDYQKNYGASGGGDPAYPAGEIANYVFSHTLRGAVDGAWGHLNKANPAQGDKTDFYFAYNLKPEWKERNCSVVAFIYNKDTKEVVQVEEKHLY